ncbi:MAG TPA: hypothetical protein VFW87_22730 [Pirellulales bacterium]|nr:hypothetical protein [Pirellulales bacterium]
MRRLGIFAAVTAVALMSGQLLAGEKIKVPQGPTGAKAAVTTAVDHGNSAVTEVGWRRRALRRGYGYGYGYGPGYYGPYTSYYYGRPYYGNSFYAPGWGYGPGIYGGVPYVGMGGWGWGGYW